MSFSNETKNALCQIPFEHTCCKREFVLGALLFSKVFSREKIEFSTPNIHVFSLLKSLIFECFDVKPQEIEKKSEKGKTTKYTLVISDKSEIESMLLRFGYKKEGKINYISTEQGKCEACANSFFRGAFLSSGFVNPPKSVYHLEFSSHSETLAEELRLYLENIVGDAKIFKRNSNYIVYLKKSENIEDFLTFIGAKKSAFVLMDKKIERDIRNNANRVANCETSNIEKSIAAAQIQIDAIRSLLESGKFALMPTPLREVAKIRLENPEMSFVELGKLCNPPQSKSGIYRKLQRIVEFANGK